MNIDLGLGSVASMARGVAGFGLGDSGCNFNADGSITCANVGTAPPIPPCLQGTGPLQPGQQYCPTPTAQTCYTPDGQQIACPDVTSANVTGTLNGIPGWAILAAVGAFLLIRKGN